MSQFLDIQEKLQDTNVAIAQLERAAQSGPASPSIISMRKSLDKKLRSLENDFQSAASKAGIDVCSYRVFADDDDGLNIGSLSTAFGNFQKLVSTVYSAIKKGPRQRAGFTAEDAKESSFNFGYAFPGSVGFVLTMSNERLLIGETDIDDSMDAIFGMVRAKEPKDILPFLKKLGAGSIRALYKWSSDHDSSGLGADIDWRRGQSVRDKMFLQAVEFSELRKVLDETGEESTKEITLTGELIAVSISSKSFQMRFESGEDIRGKFSDAISDKHKVELPKRYKAHLTKTTKTVYSFEEDEESYFLLDLKPA